MDFKNSPKKVKRVSVMPRNNKAHISKNKTIQVFQGNKISLSKKVDLAERVIVSHTKEMFFDRFENLSNIRKIVVAWVCVVAVLIFSVGIFREMSAENYSESIFYRGGTYSEGILGEVKTLNPLFTSNDVEKSFEHLAFSRLYDIDEAGSLKGDLAESVSTSDNYRNFKVKMRKNAVWSDGQRITADDVIFTTKLLKEQSINPSGFKAWKNVELSKDSDYEFSVKVPSSSSSILYSFNFSILPEHILKDTQIDKIRESVFSKALITSGAFNFKSTKNGDDRTIISLVKNKRYYKGEAYIDNFDIIAFKDESKLKSALIYGEIVASPNLKISEFSEYERGKLNSR